MSGMHASGEWRVASGEWRVTSGEWRVTLFGQWSPDPPVLCDRWSPGVPTAARRLETCSGASDHSPLAAGRKLGSFCPPDSAFGSS